MQTIGVKDTPTRRVIHRAAEFVPRPMLCIALVVKGAAFHGMYVGNHVDAWSAAAELSAQLEIVHVPRAFKRVLSMPAQIYDDLWTAAKAMYKTEPVVADGGEVIIYAPHLTEVSYTHGQLIDEVGYHVRDYFLKQPERFDGVPGMIKAHSTHVKGAGTYDAARASRCPGSRSHWPPGFHKSVASASISAIWTTVRSTHSSGKTVRRKAYWLSTTRAKCYFGPPKRYGSDQPRQAKDRARGHEQQRMDAAAEQDQRGHHRHANRDHGVVGAPRRAPGRSTASARS